MRLRQCPLSLFLLISSVHLASALKDSELPLKHDYGQDVANLAEGRGSNRNSRTEPEPSVQSDLSSPKYASSMQAKDAPIDGKDGRPHTGPWVETSAQRDRKKAKESGEEEKVAPKEKPLVKGKVPVKDGEDIPESNDGVMDDPYRAGPKEGTRGTEGGISEKSKEKESSLAGIGAEEGKKPDPPKEAPPLPHSEEQKVDGKGSSKKGSDASTEDADRSKGDKTKEKSKELGGLEVLFLGLSGRSRINSWTAETG